MSTEILRHLVDYVERHYVPTDYPAIAYQWRDFSNRKPFSGLRILDATPLFFNTSAKWIPLLAGGADLTLSAVEGVPYDPCLMEWVREIGVKVDDCRSGDYDLISDCIGLHAGMKPIYGSAELTHSGVAYYGNSVKPCFNTDNGRIKNIEGALGTGDGLVRGLKHFGMEVGSGQRWVLFGFGKIGGGVGRKLRASGAEVVVVEAARNRDQIVGFGGFEFVDMLDNKGVASAVRHATHIVTATSVAGVISESYDSELFKHGQILVNIGAEDEYGELFDPNEVLNQKIAVNFALDEPTHLRYIETTFALQNYGLEWVLKNPNVQGVMAPPAEMESWLLDIVRADGAIGAELSEIGL